jgi:hypothetical protein
MLLMIDLPNSGVRCMHGVFNLACAGCGCQEPYDKPLPQTLESRWSPLTVMSLHSKSNCLLVTDLSTHM